MGITELSVKRPIMISVVILMFIVLGLAGYSRLGVDLYPRVNIPVVTIVTVYPGAGAEEIESQIVKPVEEAVSTLSKVKTLVSSASEGVGVTAIEFTMDADPELVPIEIQRKIDGLAGKLPRDAEKPIVEKHDFRAMPIMTVALSGKRPLADTYAIAKDRVKERLQKLPGVAEVEITGGREREVKIEADKNKLEHYNLSLASIISRLAIENLNVPGGRFGKSSAEYQVRVLGEFHSLSEVEELRIPLPDGSSIPLREVASVRDGVKEVRQYSRFDGNETVGLVIRKQSDANLVATAASVRRELDRLRKTLPPDINVVITRDSSTFTKNSLADTQRSLVEGIITTGLVLLFFLREWRSTLIVMLSIPTSLIATFMMMYFAGFSFNMLSLMGLALSVGILVDDSIVVLENIHRHLKAGKKPVQAALDGRSEIGLAAVAITLSDVVVFGPIAFMTGMVGQFFRQFGLTVVFATLFSLFISFTLTPMLASRWFKEEAPAESRRSRSRSGRLAGLRTGLGELLGRIQDRYRGFLVWALSHRAIVVSVALIAVILAVSLIPLRLIGTEFMTRTDQGEFAISVEMPAGTPLDKTDKALRALEAKLATVPEVKHYFVVAGKGGQAGGHQGTIEVLLTSKDERQRTVWDVAEQVRSWGALVPGAKISVVEPSVMPGAPPGPPIHVNISGPDPEKLVAIAGDVMAIVRSTPGAVDVDWDWKVGQPEIQVSVDRLRAADAGLSVAEVARAARAALEGEVAGVFRGGSKEVDLRVRMGGLDKENPEEVGRILLSNARGVNYRLNQVAAVGAGTGPTEIRRKDRERLITVTANLQGRSLGDVSREIEARSKKLALPEGYQVSMSGETENMTSSFQDLVFALGLSVVLVYMVLVMLYESYLTPVIRMLALPLGLVGALFGLLLTGKTLNLLSIIGIIMLDGLVAKNGTLLIDYTNTLLSRGLSLREALVEAGVTRLRPIVMTSTTMIFGMLPTALALAEGSELRSSMAVVLIGGLITSTVMTLVAIPVAYTLVDDFRKWAGAKFAALANLFRAKKGEIA